MTTILMIQRAARPPRLLTCDLLTAAYQAIDD
jgi:hypothetical protein